MATIRRIVMYGDVGFDLTHKHCIDFPDEESRNAYFDGLTDKTFFENCNYNKTDNMLNLECPWTEGLKFTYCSFLYDDKPMFYFVTGSKVVNDKVTAFELKLDVWQTFLFEFKISEGMIVREHVDRWDKDGKILWRNASSEDTISVYDKCITKELTITPRATTENGYELHIGAVYINYLGKDSDKGYHRIMLPVLTVKAPEGKPEVGDIQSFLDAGDNYNFIKINQILSGKFDFAEDLNPDSIISISYEPILDKDFIKGTTVTFEITDYSVYASAQVNFNVTTGDPYLFEGWEPVKIKKSIINYVYFKEKIIDLSEVLGTDERRLLVHPSTISFSKPVKPNDGDDYSSEHEPEMFKAPYIIRTIQDSDGSLISEIPDLCWWDGRQLYFFELNDNNETSSMYFISNDVMFYHDPISEIEFWWTYAKEFSKSCSSGLAFKVPCINMDVPSDAWKSYVLSARNTDREMLQSTINQQAVTSAIGAITGMAGISGMAGSGKTGGLGFNPAQAVLGGAIGAVMSGASYLTNNHFGWEQQEIKEKAIRNQPNNLLKTATGDGIMRANPIPHTYNEQICTDNAYNQAAKRYHKFGYRVDMFDKPNIRTRKFFNFVQTSQIRVEGSLNQAIKDGIADILNNGVTIWHGEFITKDENGKFVIDYSKENIERSLL